MVCRHDHAYALCMVHRYGVTCPSGEVTGLTMSANNLTGSIPSQLSFLTSLTVMFLDSNNFQRQGSFPPCAGFPTRSCNSHIVLREQDFPAERVGGPHRLEMERRTEIDAPRRHLSVRVWHMDCAHGFVHPTEQFCWAASQVAVFLCLSRRPKASSHSHPTT